MEVLKAIAKAIGLADLWSKYFTKKDDQNTGRALERADTLQANAEQVTNAAIIEERNAALGHGALVDKLRRQTGVDP